MPNKRPNQRTLLLDAKNMATEVATGRDQDRSVTFHVDFR
jgi:hypothetical protein